MPLLALAGRRFAFYLILYPLHLAIAGVALAFIAIKAGTGDTDWLFWLSYGWIVLQVMVGRRLIVPTALALTFLAVQATQADRDGWFWLCFAWLALMILSGGATMRSARTLRRRTRQRDPGSAEQQTGAATVFAAMLGDKGFSTADTASNRPPDADTVEGSAREVNVDIADELERLAALRDAGSITSEEYIQAKRTLLG
jgi:hypothetical protein